jgi:PAS domain S-box-containing protein
LCWHGNCDGSCFAYVMLGIIAGGRFGDYQAGFRFGRLGYDLVEQRGLKRFQARTYLNFGNVVLPWTRHVKTGRDLVHRAFETAKRIGDLTYAAYSCIHLNTNLLAAGDPLVEVQREAEKGLAFARKARFGFVIDQITTQLALVRTLRGLTPRFGFFDDAQFDELWFERHFFDNPGLGRVECLYWIRKLQARFFAGDYFSAVDHARLHAELTQENSDRRKAEEALKASEERWRKLFETSSAGIALVAADGRYIAANSALQKMLGYTEEELYTLAALDVTQEEDRAATEVILAESAEERRRDYRIEKRYRRKDGNVIWADVSSTLVPATGDAPAFFATVIVDITERKRAEEALLEAQAELAHVTRVATLGELTASIAHEINQPLAAVVTNANAGLRWLSRDSPDLAEACEAIRRIIRDGNRAGEVISRMRALFKKASSTKERLDINEAIEEVVILAQSQVQRNRVLLQTQLANDLPLILGDRIQLQQVILNLLVNAIQAMSGADEGPRELWVSSQKITEIPGESKEDTLESLKGKRCCRQVKFYSGVCALVAWRFCLSRILKAGPGSWSYQI